MADLTTADWFARLDSAGVPVEIADPDAPMTWFDDPELIANGLVADYHHPGYGRFRQFGQLVHFSATPGRIAGPPRRHDLAVVAAASHHWPPSAVGAPSSASRRSNRRRSPSSCTRSNARR